MTTRSQQRQQKVVTMNQTKEVRLAGRPLDRSRHVCAFFHSKEEEYQVLLPT
jgi:hypothetical protein